MILTDFWWDVNAALGQLEGHIFVRISSTAAGLEHLLLRQAIILSFGLDNVDAGSFFFNGVVKCDLETTKKSGPGINALIAPDREIKELKG